MSGLANAHFRGVTGESIASGRLFDQEFGRELAAKLAVVAVMLGLSLVHDALLGPVAARASTAAEPAAIQRASALRRHTSWLARLTALLALVVVALALALVRGLPW